MYAQSTNGVVSFLEYIGNLKEQFVEYSLNIEQKYLVRSVGSMNRPSPVVFEGSAKNLSAGIANFWSLFSRLSKQLNSPVSHVSSANPADALSTGLRSSDIEISRLLDELAFSQRVVEACEEALYLEQPTQELTSVLAELVKRDHPVVLALAARYVAMH